MSNNLIVPENLRKEKQKFFLNTTEMAGIQSLQGGYENQASPMKFLGMGVPVMVPGGKQVGNFSLNALVIDSDRFLSFTGNAGFNGYILKSRTDTNQNFSFTSGYLTSYESRASVGSIPEVSVNFSAFGNVGYLISSEPSANVSSDFSTIAAGSTSLTPQIAGPGSITLSLSDFTSNRVLSYNLNIDCPRNPIYPLGTKYPTAVEINWPITVSLNLQYAVNTYVARNLRDFPNNQKIENLVLTLKTFDTDATITTYRFNEMSLIKESYNIGTEGHAVIDATYKVYLGRPIA